MKWEPSKLTREQMEERRLEAGHLFKEGELSNAQIANVLGVSRAAVTLWRERYRTGGARRLKQSLSSGRPPKLTAGEKRKLAQKLEKGALTAGFSTDRWTLERIAQLIEQEFGVNYHPNYLNRLLEQICFSLQVPLARAKERDEELIAAWLLKDWPRIKKKRGGAAQK